MGALHMAGIASGGMSILATEPRAPDWPRMPAIAPFTGPMRLTLCVSPEGTWPVLRDLIDHARHTLAVAIYNITASHIIEALERALGRGVVVRLMVDATDPRGGEAEKVERLREAFPPPALEFRRSPSTNPRAAFTVCHQKYVVADGTDILLGSANFAGTGIPQVDDPLNGPWKKGNREWLAAIRGNKAAARFFIDLFDLDWNWQPSAPGGDLVAASSVPFEMATLAAAADEPPATRFAPLDVALPASARVTPLVSPQNYLAEVTRLLEGATREVCIQQQYVSIERPDKHIAQLLRTLAALPESVGIRILVSPKYPDGVKKTRKALSAHGLVDRLRFQDLTSYEHCHNKGVIVDRKAVIVSSTNWSDNSVGAAREAGLLIEDAAAAAYYQAVFDADWAGSVSLDAVQRQAVSILSETLSAPPPVESDGSDDL
jgi:cardiolipin synthase A/B